MKNNKIKFGTDGWRAIIGDQYTNENVARVSFAVADWLNENFDDPTVIIGHDCRFAGKMFAETTTKMIVALLERCLLKQQLKFYHQKE